MLELYCNNIRRPLYDLTIKIKLFKMKSVLRKGLKRKIIFTLGFLLDVYQELSVRNYYQKLYSPLYERTTITETLSRMSTTGEIEKKLINNTPVFCISTKGLKLLDEIIPLKNLSDKPWDGLWRIVIFDIEEKEKHIRDLIRRKLKSLGFAMWQESVYLTPHPIAEEMNEFLEEKNLIPRCICFEAKQPNVFSSTDFTENLFNLDVLKFSYNKLNNAVLLIMTDYKDKNINRDEAFKSLAGLMEKFQNLLMKDPFLPKELIPDFVERDTTQKTFSRISKYIAKT